MPNRNVSLTDHFDGFVEESVNSGQYKNASEVVRAGLQLLEQRQREDALRLERLRAAAKVGFDDLDQGRYVELNSDEELRAHLAKIADAAKARVRARHAA